jgi:ribonuclease I
VIRSKQRLEWGRVCCKLANRLDSSLQAAKQAAEERAKQEEIEAAYRAAIPDEVNQKVRIALEQQLPDLRSQLEKKMQEREQALLTRLAALQV